MKDRETLEAIWWSGVNRVRGHDCVLRYLKQSKTFKPTHIAAVGKAAFSMAQAALDHCGQSLPALVVTKYGHIDGDISAYENLNAIESGHPVPDENSLLGGQALQDFVSDAGKDATLLLLVSGRASSLAEKLSHTITLDDLQRLNNQMLADGFDIHAINEKRKQISEIKNGKLLSYFHGKQALVLAISDVEGDAIDVIGSGIGALPHVLPVDDMQVEIIASNAIARLACESAAEANDLEVIVNSESLYGDVFEVAHSCAKTVSKGAPGLYVFGGEPVITLPENPGEGGRNQALAVAMAKEISGSEGISVLVAGTDGSDGPTGSAGGFVTGQTWHENTGGQEALDAADSGAWLRKSGGLFVSGPTGTNVMDLMLVLKH